MLVDYARANGGDAIVYCGTVFVALVALRLVRIGRTCLTYAMPARADYVKFADGGYALITGGAGGIGKGERVALVFMLRMHWTVVVHSQSACSTRLKRLPSSLASWALTCF